MSSTAMSNAVSRAGAQLPWRYAAAALALLLFAAAPVSVQAQAAGDVVTLCWNSDNDDDFSVITLAALPGGTRIFFSDNGWSTSQNNLMQEGVQPSPNRQIQFDVAAAGIPFGTVIEFDQAGGTATLVNPALGTVTMVSRFTVMGTPLNGISFNSNLGDQLLVWRTTNNQPTGTVAMISGFSGSIYQNLMPGPGDGIITQVNGWQVGTLPQPSQAPAGGSESNAPGGLIAYDGSNAATATALGLAGFNVGGLQGQDNYRYSGPTGLGTKTAYLTAINNPANWTANDVTPFSCTFGISAVPEIAVTGNAVNIADGDNTPSAADNTDFGGVDVISATLARTFTITNSGSAALTIGAVTFTGANPGDFSVTGAPASSVAAGGSTTVQVTFNPSAVGLRSATISIANNDADENPFDFAIQGTGTQPEIAVSGNAVNIVDGDITPSLADHTDFGNANVTTGVVTRTFTVSNTGNSSLSLGTVLVSGTNAADYLVTQQPNGPVTGGGSTTFQVSFGPGAAGLRTASLSMGNGDADENPFDFSIQGTGVVLSDAIFSNGFE